VSARGRLLLDTGPLVAILDRRDRWHAACVAAVAGFTGRCVTTEAVVTEACHLLSHVSSGAVSCLGFLLRTGTEIVPMTEPRLHRVTALMTKYADLPMDYADATLVAAAEALGLREVFTLDRRGFSVYRALDREPFLILPGD